MSRLTFSDVYQVPLSGLGEAVGAWKAMADALDELATEASEGMHKRSERARWAGVNAGVTKPFVGKTAGEIRDAHVQAKSIWSVLRDAQSDLTEVRSALRKAYDEDAAVIGCGVTDLRDGTVRCVFPGGPTAAAEFTPEQTEAKDRLESRINRLVARAEEIDTSVARALRKSHGGNAHDFGHARYTSLDDAQAERALELAALGPDMSNRQLAEFNTLVKHNGREPNGRFATLLYEGLGGPEEALRFYGRMSINGTEGDNPERLAGVRELQRNMGHALANATEPDAPKGLEGRKYHLPESWGAEFRRLGTQPIELERGAFESPLGYQVLGGLLRYGNYDPEFLNPIAEHVTQLHREDLRRFLWNKPTLPGDEDYGFNPSGKNGAGYIPLNSVLEALGHSPEAATKFFTDTPTVYREDGTADRSAEADFTQYLNVFADEEFKWPADSLLPYPDGPAAATGGPDALGHALEAATTGRPYDVDPSVFAVKHTAEQAELAVQVVDLFGINQEMLRRNENGEISADSGPLYAMRDSLGNIVAEYMPDVQRALYSSGEDSIFRPFGESANFRNESIQSLLSVISQDPEAYGSITAAQRALTSQLVDEAVNGGERPGAYDAERLRSVLAPGALMAGIMSEARIEAVHEYHAASDEAFNESVADKQKWVDRILGAGIDAAASRVPAAGNVIGWLSEDIQESIVKGVSQDTATEAQVKAGAAYAGGRDAVIEAAREAVVRAGRRGGVDGDTVRVLSDVAAIQAGSSHVEGVSWGLSIKG
ncbi:DUF6571 family protein [Streptomyces zingiberis]|uniref:Phage protein n=1 Tax=Streptomyces zingiberis TaxID=2053010 RepID=A0ABX1C1S2_9ACTN|nr:DUF6571 family protein [Streptomyces zingiberis]NJQ02726.1 hypothetical protein [Streptomyces zingiberis]